MKNAPICPAEREDVNTAQLEEKYFKAGPMSPLSRQELRRLLLAGASPKEQKAMMSRAEILGAETW